MQEQEKLILQRKEVLTWFSTYDYVGIQKAAADLVHPNTCRWIFDSTVFQSWGVTKHPNLWLKGPSGSGKTITTASVIDHLQQCHSRRTLAYLYCNSNDVSTQGEADIVGALLHQLLASLLSVPRIVQTYFDSCAVSSGQRHKPTLSGLEECITNLVNDNFEASGIDLILDAVNEAQRPPALLNWILNLQNQCANRIRLFVSSSTLPEIEIVLDQFLQLRLDCSDHDTDIASYVDDRLASMTRFRSLPEPLRSSAKARLKEGAHGM